MTKSNDNSGLKFKKELADLLNKYSKENGSNTPDFILAEYLILCLVAFDYIMQEKKQWES